MVHDHLKLVFTINHALLKHLKCLTDELKLVNYLLQSLLDLWAQFPVSDASDWQIVWGLVLIGTFDRRWRANSLLLLGLRRLHERSLGCWELGDLLLLRDEDVSLKLCLELV